MTPTTMTAQHSAANPDRFSAALRNVYRVRPRVPVDTWTDLDAAAWWYKDYNPDSVAALSPGMILGIVARLFVRKYKEFRPLRKLWHKLTNDLGHWCLGGVTMSGDLAWNLSHFCGAIHSAYCPGDSDANTDDDTRMSDLCIPARGYCGRKTCSNKHSWYRGCMNEIAYEKLHYHNLLRPWGLVDWMGVGMLFTPLRHSLHTPCLSIRKSRSHITKPVVPYYVADKLEFMHRFAPAAMASVAFQNWVRPQIGHFVETCSSQRLRFQAMVALDPNSSALMRNWDKQMTTKMWDFMFEDTDMVYDSDMDWGIEYETLKSLQENPPVGMFPAM